MAEKISGEKNFFWSEKFLAEIKKKKRPAPKKSVRRLLKGFIFLLICGLILGIVVYSPLFTLTEIRVIGANEITAEDVKKIANLYIGEPLFKLETDQVAGRLSKDLRIEEVTVRRSLPHTLEVTIKERKPIATIVCNYGYLDIDRQGKIIDSYKTLKTMQIPMITGATVTDLYIGDDVDNPIVKKILEFMQKLDEKSINKISEIAIVSENYIVAYTNTEKAVQIRIGKIERLDEKARLTDDFLRDLETNPNPVEYVDFNYTAPFIKLAQ